MEFVYTCYPGGKFKALTMSYDDGKEADRRLVSIFNRHGIKGAFHINGGMIGTPGRLAANEIRTLYEGQEISCHTATHPTIERCPLPAVANEILEDRRILEALAGYPVRGLSYPNGSWSPEIVGLLPGLGIRYARVVGDTHNFELPRDFYRWTSTCHHNHNLMENAWRFAEFDKSQYLRLMYVWGHSYEFDNDGNWELIEEFCAFMGGRGDIWYATNIELVDYLEAAGRLQFTASGGSVYNPSAASVWVRVSMGEPVEVRGGEYKRLF